MMPIGCQKGAQIIGRGSHKDGRPNGTKQQSVRETAGKPRRNGEIIHTRSNRTIRLGMIAGSRVQIASGRAGER
jgi:hypothetical protein